MLRVDGNRLREAPDQLLKHVDHLHQGGDGDELVDTVAAEGAGRKVGAGQSAETVADNTDICGSAADSLQDVSTNGKTCDIAPDDGTSSDIRDVAPSVEQHPGYPDSDDKDE